MPQEHSEHFLGYSSRQHTKRSRISFSSLYMLLAGFAQHKKPAPPTGGGPGSRHMMRMDMPLCRIALTTLYQPRVPEFLLS
jgi:hypothetical protein